MYNQSLINHNNNTSVFIATTFDDFSKKKKVRSENRKNYYGYLVRPDGSPLSEKDCLLLDLCIQWTKGGKICTSTYSWLLANKFPRQRHNRTVSRTFNNISLYIKANFKNSQVINSVMEKDKIKIERVADFDQKMIEAIQKSEEKNDTTNPTKCQPSTTKTSTMDDKNVNPSTYIYKKTIKITSDNHDHENQFKNTIQSEVIDNAETEQLKVATEDIVETEVIGLAEKESEETEDFKNEIVECVETIGSLQSKQNVTSTSNRRKVIGKDGKIYYTTPLVEFRYTDSLLEKIISLSNKRDNKDYTPAKVKVIMRNILEKDPDKQIWGGRKGFINYMVKAVNGETEYSEDDDKNKIQSMTMIKAKKQQELSERLALYKQGKLNQDYAYM